MFNAMSKLVIYKMLANTTNNSRILIIYLILFMYLIDTIVLK